MSTSPVRLHVYDLSGGLASQLTAPGSLLNASVGPVDGIWHTGVHAFDREYYYGQGIHVALSQEEIPHRLYTVIDLPPTQRSREDWEAHVRDVLAGDFTPERYNLLEHNCNHFSDAAIQFLCPGSRIPEHIRTQPQHLMQTPLGQMMRPWLERAMSGVQLSPQGFPLSLGASRNPFADAAQHSPSPSLSPSPSPSAAGQAFERFGMGRVDVMVQKGCELAGAEVVDAGALRAIVDPSVGDVDVVDRVFGDLLPRLAEWQQFPVIDLLRFRLHSSPSSSGGLRALHHVARARTAGLDPQTDGLDRKREVLARQVTVWRLVANAIAALAGDSAAAAHADVAEVVERALEAQTDPVGRDPWSGPAAHPCAAVVYNYAVLAATASLSLSDLHVSVASYVARALTSGLDFQSDPAKLLLRAVERLGPEVAEIFALALSEATGSEEGEGERETVGELLQRLTQWLQAQGGFPALSDAINAARHM